MHNKEELLKTFYTSLFEIEQKRDEIKADIQNLEEQVEIIKKSDNEAREVISINEKLIGLSSKADKAIEQAKKTLEDNKDLLDKKKNKIEELRVELNKLNEQIKKMVDVLYELMGKEEVEKYLKSLDGYSEEDLIEKIIYDNDIIREKAYKIIHKFNYESDEEWFERVSLLNQINKTDIEEMLSNIHISTKNRDCNSTEYRIELNYSSDDKAKRIFEIVLSIFSEKVNMPGYDLEALSNDNYIYMTFKRNNSSKYEENKPDPNREYHHNTIKDRILTYILIAKEDFEFFTKNNEFKEAVQEERKKSFYKLFGIDLAEPKEKKKESQEEPKPSIEDVIEYTVDEITILKQRKEILSLDKKESDFRTTAEELRKITVYEPLIASCRVLARRKEFYDRFTEISQIFKDCIDKLQYHFRNNKRMYLDNNVIERCNIVIDAFNNILVNITNKEYNMDSMNNLVNQMNIVIGRVEDENNIKKIPLLGSKEPNQATINTLENTYNSWYAVNETIKIEKKELEIESDKLISQIILSTDTLPSFVDVAQPTTILTTSASYKKLEEELYLQSGIEPRDKIWQRKQIIDNILQLYYELNGQKPEYDVYEELNLERFLDDVSRLISQRKQERKDELTRIDERLPKLESLLYDLNQFGYFVKDISAEELKKAESGIKR